MWNFQRREVMSVRWPKPLSFKRGHFIRCVGKLVNESTLDAWSIVERDGTLHQVAPVEELEEDPETMYPVEGKVVGCTTDRGQAYISLYQTIPRLFSFPTFAHHRAFLPVPEFWSYLEDRSEWDDEVVPNYQQVAAIRSKKFVHPDLRQTAPAIYRYCELANIKPLDFLFVTLGQVDGKLKRMHSLRQRTEYCNALYRHLLMLRSSDGRDYLLESLINDCAMTLEYASVTAYSVLDIMAHIVNKVLNIGQSELQISFTSILGRATTEEPGPNLLSVFPSHPLTQFWLDEQADWASGLRDLRHFVAHKGIINPMHGPNPTILASPMTGGLEQSILDVEESVSDWTAKTMQFFMQSLRHLTDHCIEAAKSLEGMDSDKEMSAPLATTKLQEALKDILLLLNATDGSQPDRVERLYSRLEKSWKKDWPILKFTKFIESIRKVEISNTPVGAGTDGRVEWMSIDLSLTTAERMLGWHLELRRELKKKPVLKRTLMTTLLAPVPATDVIEFSARQSGSESNHSCAEFRFRLSNIAEERLRGVTVAVLHSGLPVVEEVTIGDFAAGDSREVFLSTTEEFGRYVPPGGPAILITLISSPVHIRVTYGRELEMGNYWADEHGRGSYGLPKAQSN